jgi:hypothetical protein
MAINAPQNQALINFGSTHPLTDGSHGTGSQWQPTSLRRLIHLTFAQQNAVVNFNAIKCGE